MTDRAAAFLGMIDATRKARLEEIERRSADEVRAILRGARSEARDRVHRAVVENRERSRRDLAAAKAELETAFRKLSQETHGAALRDGMSELVRVLEARWRDPEARARWIAAAIAEAERVLPKTRWRIEHPPSVVIDVPGSETVPAEIGAGLRITAGTATLDATLDGLLARRAEVEGRLLHELDTEVGA
jgi:hypothetical protein